MYDYNYSYLLKTENCSNVKIDWQKLCKYKLENFITEPEFKKCRTLYDLSIFFNGKLLYGYFDSDYYKTFDAIANCLIWDNVSNACIYFDLNHKNIIWSLNFFNGNNWCIKSTTFKYDHENLNEYDYIKYMFKIINRPDSLKSDIKYMFM